MYPFTATFVPVMLTNTGAQQIADYPTMKECLQQSSLIKKVETFCIEKKPLDDKEVTQFIQFFNKLTKEIAKESSVR